MIWKLIMRTEGEDESAQCKVGTIEERQGGWLAFVAIRARERRCKQSRAKVCSELHCYRKDEGSKKVMIKR